MLPCVLSQSRMVDSQPFSVDYPKYSSLFQGRDHQQLLCESLRMFSACLSWQSGRWVLAHGFEFHLMGLATKQLIWFNLLLWGKLVLAAFNSGVHKFADFHVEVRSQCPLFDGFEAGSWANTTCPWSGRKLSAQGPRGGRGGKAASEIGTVDNMFDLCWNSDNHVQHISSYSI